MIVTVTPNLSVDRTIEVPRLTRGAVLRATAAWAEPGARASMSPGRCRARHEGGCGPAQRGAEGQQLAALLAAECIEVVQVPLAGDPGQRDRRRT